MAVDGCVNLAMLMNGIGDGLRVGSRTRSTAVDSVMNMGELVGDTVGLKSAAGKGGYTHNVRTGGGPGICANHDTSVKLNRHDGGLRSAHHHDRILTPRLTSPFFKWLIST